MEESDELKSRAMASEVANMPPKAELPSKTREEGELSCSDNGDENPDCTSAPPSGTIAPAAGSSSVPLVNKDIQGTHAGPSNIQLKTTIQSTSQRSFNKNQLPPKSAVWSVHASTDKNLVISFSDDDSGSDFEEYRQGKLVESKGNTFKLDSNQKPPISYLAKSNKAQHNSRSVQKAMTKRLSSNRTFFSSVAKTHGSNPKGSLSLALGQGSQPRNFNTLNKSLAIRECGVDQGVVLNDNKLQDLRHQIALRESELKLKAAQQNKESASVISRDHNSMKLKNDAARKYTPVSSKGTQLDPTGPDRKRLKLSKPSAIPPVLGSQQGATKPIALSKESTWENGDLQERNKVDHSKKNIPICRGESTIVKSQRQHGKHLDTLQNVPYRPRDGADVNNGYSEAEKNSRLVHPSDVFNQSLLPENMTSNSIPRNLTSVDCTHTPSLINKAATVSNLKRGLDHNEVISRDKELPLNDAVLLSYDGNSNVSEYGSTDIQMLFEMDDLIDKQLAEAQEHRHKCEIEERKALKACVKAQRALVEANARCTSLYHKRESYSAKLRSLILNHSSFSWPSGQQEHQDMGLDYLSNMTGHGYVISMSNCQKQAEYNDFNQPGFDANNQGITNGPSNTSYHHMTGENLGSEPCSEPDASTSEPLPHKGNDIAVGLYSPSDELDTSANETEMSPGRHVSTQDVEDHREQESKSKLIDVDTVSNTRFCADSPQDSLLLEATLRSELFARLGKRASKGSSTSNIVVPAAERGAENEVGNQKNLINQIVGPLSGAQEIVLKGNEQDRSIFVDPVENQSQQNVGGTSLNSFCSTGSGDLEYMAHQSNHLTNVMSRSSMIFRSAFSHLKAGLPLHSNEFQSKCQQSHINYKDVCLISDEAKWSNMSEIPMPVSVQNLLSDESSYSCSPPVDPFWPLCMFELRGKCNNDECPWQHIKDYCDGNIDIHQHADSKDADCQGGLTSQQQKSTGVRRVPDHHKAKILPTYIVGLDVLRADQLTYKSVMARRNTQCWQKYFSMTLATSNLLQNGSPANGPFLHGGDGRIEVHGTGNKQLSYFQWRSVAMNPTEQVRADNEQAIEMALLILNQENNKLEGVRKALSLLSRAVETDPTSAVLWIVYLLIYYGNIKPVGKDDMFLYAVKHNEESYVLWLMYINSRKQLDDRLAAYDAALSALCQHASASGTAGTYASACILDLFLQMMYCLCMSRNVEKAIQRSYGVFPATNKSDEPDHLSLSDVINCLTIPDKCVFWVCCVYLVIYSKLPEAVVQRFECEKELLDIEWPFVQLSEEEKQMSVKLVETAVGSVESYIYNESAKSEVNLRSAQLFALNHIRCMVALNHTDCLRNLLDKYVKLYPSCIELVLASAHIQKEENEVDSFTGFEEAINRWPKEAPGIQCIWNQYIENTMKNRGIDVAKEITSQWFHSVWQVEPQTGAMDAADGATCGSLGLNAKSVPDSWGSDCSQMDVMFAYLNLSLYKFFLNDEKDAHIAVEKAKKAAISGGLEYCMRKHIMFLLCDALRIKEDGPYSDIKKVLEIYTDDSCWAFLYPKPLTRKFVDDIKKPRVQQLISNILCPVSCDFSLLNLILQSWYGPSFLPGTFSDSTHLVDFVEAILEVVPSNFQLAFCVCKLLSKSHSSTDLTSASLQFWACSTMVNAILDAIPIPPEDVWLDAGGLLPNVRGIETIVERFYGKALSVYPFSVQLWKSFYNLSKNIGDASAVFEAAKDRGIQFD